ncbi:hypothetical protein Snoj_39260 [Streptomyces nojiriensis]|uniref:Lycopene cyclase n=1 Tax=Streptomyces nojiriensis TaxID=66374 RepID=A0ABQ3SPE7_9ACTN|nr:hypothetical protein GCM10010205_07910 [Streptomyces nojiriensis]GHI70008.1 hypothetical protein Snoj_39260 [Streptomyces nojiriensis]
MGWDADVAVVGAGAAGLSLAVELAKPLPGNGRRPAPRVVVVEAPPGPLRWPARTWCYWEADVGPYDGLLAASWNQLRVYAADGAVIDRPLGRLRYKMLRSDRFEAAMAERLDAYGVDVRRTTVESAQDAGAAAVVCGRDASGARSVLRSSGLVSTRGLCGSYPPPGPRCSSASWGGSCARPSRPSIPAWRSLWTRLQ